MTITIKHNRIQIVVNSVIAFLNTINESNHAYYLNNGTVLNPDTFDKDVEAYHKYHDCIWYGNEVGYLTTAHNILFKNIDIQYSGENEYAKYSVVTLSKVTTPPIDKFIFNDYDEFLEYCSTYDINETPNYEGMFDWFLEKHYKSIDLSSNIIFLIKDL